MTLRLVVLRVVVMALGFYMDRLVAYGTGLALPGFSESKKSQMKPTDY
jgi:hypothetical protein